MRFSARFFFVFRRPYKAELPEKSGEIFLLVVNCLHSVRILSRHTLGFNLGECYGKQGFHMFGPQATEKVGLWSK
jgi:hypothetical protein